MKKIKNKAIATQEPDGMSEFLEYCYSQGDGFGVCPQCARPPVRLSVRLHSPHQCKHLVPTPAFVLLCFCCPCLLCARGLLKFWPERLSFRMSHLAAGSHKITGASRRDHLSGALPRVSCGLGGSVWSLVSVGTEQPSPPRCCFTFYCGGPVTGKGVCLLCTPPPPCLKKQLAELGL